MFFFHKAYLVSFVLAIIVASNLSDLGRSTSFKVHGGKEAIDYGVSVGGLVLPILHSQATSYASSSQRPGLQVTLPSSQSVSG